jgi:death-on-curing protein
VVARLFLADNFYTLQFDPAEAVTIVESLAAGTIDEQVLADWFRARIRGTSLKDEAGCGSI